MSPTEAVENRTHSMSSNLFAKIVPEVLDIRKTHFYKKNRVFYDIMRKNMVEPARLQITI
jgi:hypothetical protein